MPLSTRLSASVLMVLPYAIVSWKFAAAVPAAPSAEKTITISVPTIVVTTEPAPPDAGPKIITGADAIGNRQTTRPLIPLPPVVTAPPRPAPPPSPGFTPFDPFVPETLSPPGPPAE